MAFKTKTWELPEGAGQGPRPKTDLPKNPFPHGGGMKAKKLKGKFGKPFTA